MIINTFTEALSDSAGEARTCTYNRAKPEETISVQAIHYAVTPLDPARHLFSVQCRIERPTADGQLLSLPSWIRGSYLVRDFAKHIVEFRADCDGKALGFERIDKRSLRIDACEGPLTLHYTVHAFDESVRKAYLDSRRGFFNGSSLFYRVVGADEAGYEMELQRAPYIEWKASTAMQPRETDSDGFGTYFAPDYEDLIDHPVELGPFTRLDFDVDGVPHAMVLSGRFEVDEARLRKDVAAICHVEREMFEQQPKLDRFLFLTNVVGMGYGGLEHRASTALICSRGDLPRPGDASTPKAYRQFLGLVSHEYFHLWNVKRITAASFHHSDLASEAYTRDLWHYEGVTSYYDDLFLLRAGLVDATTYLDVLSEQATRLQRTPGRQVHSLAESSFETWIKYYQPDDNTPNATVSYYIKGAIAALCLDLTLRLKSGKTLDDVMRAMWRRYGATGKAVPEGGLEAMAQSVSGLDLSAEFDDWLRGTGDLPLSALLAEFGVDAKRRAAVAEADAGGRTSGTPMNVWLGCKLRPGSTNVGYVLTDGPAAAAGLSGGDQIMAVDGLRVSATNWSSILASLWADEPVTVHYFRGDELMSTALKPSLPPQDTWTIALTPTPGEAALARRKAWLGL